LPGKFDRKTEFHSFSVVPAPPDAGNLATVGLSRFNPPSHYQLIENAGATDVHARGAGLASGMIRYPQQPLSWRGKVMNLSPSAI